jgi:hypothetical protein
MSQTQLTQDVLSKTLKLIAEVNSRGVYYLNIAVEDVITLFYEEYNGFDAGLCKHASIATKHSVIVEISLCEKDEPRVDIKPIHICDCVGP